MDSELFTTIYNDLLLYSGNLISEWNTQWTLIAVVVLLIIMVIRKDKPVTSLALLFWNGLKKFFNQIRKVNLKPKKLQLTRLFEALELLTGDHKKRYKIPTYIALSNDVDLADLLTNIDAGHREKLILKQHKSDGDKDWFIFDQGCVISHPNPIEIAADLRQYRPERPIDGIIVCLSAERLQKDESIKIDQNAEKIYQQLWKLQQDFGFILPVYLLICDCDRVTGFEQFWKFKDLKHHHDGIFGWSNPNDENKPFEKKWIKQALQGIVNSLRHIHVNFIKDEQSKASTEILLFPNELNQLITPITRFCTTTFGNSSYHRSFMFRGIYFSGKLRESEEHPYLPKFLEELFSKKIFSEANLAYAPEKKLFSSNDKLRLYQYISASIFLAMSTWLIFDSIDLKLQGKNLINKIETVPAVPSSDRKGIQFVGSVLNHISTMDANKLNYGSIPWSWVSNIDDRLVDYFSNNIFGDIIFPAFECKMNEQLLAQINQRTENNHYSEWLENLSSNLEIKGKLTELMQGTEFSRSQVSERFDYLVKNLFNEKLPNSFYKHSTLYFDAIKNKSYYLQNSGLKPLSRKAKRQLCIIEKIDKRKLWNRVKQEVNEQNQYIRQKVAFPKRFFDQLTELQSLPAVMSWDFQAPDFSQALFEYNRWASHMQQYWLLGHSKNNSCQRINQSLQIITRELGTNDINYTRQHQIDCEDNVFQQLEEDNSSYLKGLYDYNEQQYSFSLESEQLLDAINKVASLSFIQVNKPNHFDKNDTDFFWSVEHLNQALHMFEEYQTFANKNYKSIHLPLTDSEKSHNYLAQAVALKQLQLAMLTAISDARTKKLTQFKSDNLQPVNQQEAYLQSHTANFREAMDALINIHNKFKLLNFSESSHWLLQISNAHAFKLLEKVDSIYQDSRLYAPLPKPYWGVHNYTQALFGIVSSDQLKDYLTAQSERINFIAFSYAEPLLTYLKTTDSMSVDYQLFSKWEKTLIELNKQQNKNPANSQNDLEQFFSNQLMVIDQSNCFKETKNLSQQQQNNLFSISQTLISELAKKRCTSFRADKIASEYQQVNKLFIELLAGSYPFSSLTSSGNISPATMKVFISRYPGKSSGLAQRMEVLAWKKQEYEDALDFINNLDASIEFFNTLFGAATNSEGVEIVSEFNVLQQKANQVAHIVNWKFNSGSYFSSYPGAPENIFWLPDDTTELTLNWAINSPFTALAIDGNTRSNQLSYKISGIWSLLEFIQQYRSDTHDSKAMLPESILLNFKAKLSAKNPETTTGKTPDALAYMRLTLYGMDPETKKKTTIKIPEKFPDHAPFIQQGK